MDEMENYFDQHIAYHRVIHSIKALLSLEVMTLRYNLDVKCKISEFLYVHSPYLYLSFWMLDKQYIFDAANQYKKEYFEMNRAANRHEPTTCRYAEEHDNNPLRYICLENQCQLNRLLCKTCLKNSHAKHNKWPIDKLIFPLDRLSMHSNYQGSTEDYAFLRQQVQIIRDEWQRMTDLFRKVQEDLNAGFVRQLEILMITFSTEEIDKAEKVLTNKESDIQQINKYVQMLNFLQKEQLSDVNAMKKFAGDNTQKIAKVIKWAAKKMGHLLEKATQIINAVDFSNYSDVKKEEPKVSKPEYEEILAKMEEEELREARRPQRRPNTNPQAEAFFAPPSANSNSSSTRKTMLKYK